MALGKLILTGLALGAFGVAASRKTTTPGTDPNAPDPNAPDPNAPDTDGPLVEAFIGGAEDGQDLPLIFVLHAEGSTPEAAIAVLSPISYPARVLAPTGRYSKDGGRYFVNPTFSGTSYWIALRKELTRLGAELEDAITTSTPLPKPPRAIVVGLGAAGSLAIGLGLQMPNRVRYAWGVGGAVPSSWVLLSMPNLNNQQRPSLRKITFGEAIAVDNETAKIAKARGNDLELMQMNGPPDLETVQKWMLADLQMFLLTP
jgi:hypothetical protein